MEVKLSKRERLYCLRMMLAELAGKRWDGTRVFLSLDRNDAAVLREALELAARERAPKKRAPLVTFRPVD